MLTILNSMRPLVSRIVYTSVVASLTPVVWAISVAFEPSSTRSGTPTGPKEGRTSRQAQSISSSSFDLDSSSPSTCPSSPLSSDDECVGTGSELGGDDAAAVSLVMPWLVGMEGKEARKEGDSKFVPVASPLSPSPSTSSSDLALSPSSSPSSNGLITPSSSFFGPLPVVETINTTDKIGSSFIKDLIISQKKKEAVPIVSSSLSLEQLTTLVSPPTIEPNPTLPSIAHNTKPRTSRNKARKAQPKKVEKDEVVVAPPVAKKSSEARSRKDLKKAKRVPFIPSTTPQVVVVVEEEKAHSQDSVVVLEEVEVVASPPPYSQLPTPSPPRFSRPRSSTSPITPLETVLAEILVQYQDPDCSSSLDDAPTSITIPLPFFLDLAAKAASPNAFDAFLDIDIDEFSFSSLSPRPSTVGSSKQRKLVFELNADGKFVESEESNDLQLWLRLDQTHSRVLEEGHYTPFSGYRFVRFEGGAALWLFEKGKKIATKEGRGSGWRVGGSPLRRSWVGEE
ncbi:hypothetical protein BDY24DRAFT_370152 [Mrakia frigida]|uniref:uncharacterized protein n=1 Tax=Mrakia frigida TaxID=29902 RepID=UPI003FCC02FF